MITNCDWCHKEYQTKPSEYARKKRHFCSRECYAQFLCTLKGNKCNAWQGGITTESYKKWCKNHKDKIRMQTQARRAKISAAPGHHTRKQWLELLDDSGHTCVMEDGTCSGRLACDHIVALEMGGSDDISNCQVMCTRHNSLKRHKLYVSRLLK